MVATKVVAEKLLTLIIQGKNYFQLWEVFIEKEEMVIFVYQTYVFNSKSGRKDKKIYQSLGTKDKGQAELLKKLDIKYQKKVKLLSYLQYPSITICLIAILTFLFYVYKGRERFAGSFKCDRH